MPGLSSYHPVILILEPDSDTTMRLGRGLTSRRRLTLAVTVCRVVVMLSLVAMTFSPCLLCFDWSRYCLWACLPARPVLELGISLFVFGVILFVDLVLHFVIAKLHSLAFSIHVSAWFYPAVPASPATTILYSLPLMLYAALFNNFPA